MKILSLFDGMACGMIAMLNAGIEVESYDAYEIDKYAIQVSSNNFPNIKHHGDVFQADFTQYEGVDYLIGGSPCTYWSIAQKNNRETEASGMGWELFSQYVRALREAQPMFFIYENNKSMSKAIRESITETFGFEPVLINSALVSAQNRQRLYWVGKRNPDGTYSRVPVDQPEDRGILLRDVLDGFGAKSLTEREMDYMVRSTNGKYSDRWAYLQKPGQNDKALCITANISKGVPYNICVEPIGIGYRGRMDNGKWVKRYESNEEPKANALTTAQTVGTYPNDAKNHEHDPQQYRIYSTHGKSVCLKGNGGGMGAKTGLYAVPYDVEELSEDYYHGHNDGNVLGKIACKNTSDNNGQPAQGTRVYKTGNKSICLDADSRKYVIADAPASGWCVGKNGKKVPIYEVKDGQITIKGKQYPIKLKDGFYIIRKLTVRECMRLQTVPEDYDFSVISETQAYKCLGNGWTCEVITHLINATQKSARRKWLDDLLGYCL